MLPLPASLSRPRTFRRVNSPGQRWKDTLLKPSRATNLAIILLSGACFVSLLFNIRYTISASFPVDRTTTASALFSTIARTRGSSNLDHLVVVPCHAIWQGANASTRLSEEDWILEPYQRGSSRVNAFFQHIAEGTKLAAKDPRSLLVFSGGQTRPSSPSTESESYLRLALSADLLNEPNPSPLTTRTTTENHALDSYQNLLFSIARFREYTGRFPTRITVVGYAFKQARFRDLHRKAIRWPASRFRYIGVDPDDEHSTQALDGELKNGYLPYSTDLYGCHSFLLDKRRQRNPFLRFHSYYTSTPELAPLLDWCPDSHKHLEKSVFTGPLPWDQ